MPLPLFVLIAWVTIIIFSIVPKKLDLIENIIMFFSVSIIEINISTIATLNLGLIENSKDPKMFISLLINRNITIPLWILIFINLTNALESNFKKISIEAITLFILVFVKLLALWTGVKVYTGWNSYYDVISLLGLMIFSTFFAKMLKKLE
ncbi:hypothetical protein GOM49_09855 [Clostridium bovifaecis]|uniref:Uncharacterized protein n=1 Tax=Clostridium bovifaecis TaxID=2184719 RepID=A0A6I6EYI6_9CLOT|nr:hypothetical protein GOM49_09855 [Clostridium bovifaecis]